MSATKRMAPGPWFLLLALVGPPSVFTQTFSVSGVVRDSTTGEALAAANIRINGTSRGTISNADGLFRLSLPVGPHALIVSFIGYRPDTVRLNLSSDVHRDVVLAPIAIRLSEIVVTDEDPAYGIMRKVIENKSRWREGLRTYRFEAFTRQILRRDTAIASITESYTTGYWQQGDTLREVIRQKRQTENIQISQNFAAVGGIVNFYDDEIRFSGFTFVGPTSPEAFEYYSFALVETRETGGVEQYSIRMTSRTKLTPLFSGMLTVVGGSYALSGVEVIPNESYRLPFVTKMDVRYAQQFALYDGTFWMPVDIRLRGSAEIGFAGFSFPKIAFEQVSSIYDYALNVEVPDTLFQKPRRITAPEAEVFDSTFWAEKEVLALTVEEEVAYRSLDSTQTLQKQFQPSGPLMTLSNAGTGFLRYIDLRFNRVEGLFLGASVQSDSLNDRLSLEVKAGYGFADKRSKFGGALEWYLTKSRSVSIGLAAHSDIAHIPDEGFHQPFFIAFSSLFYKTDLRDYYYVKGGTLSFSLKPLFRLALRASYTDEMHQFAPKKTDYSFFFRSRQYRPQPSISEGKFRVVTISARYGDKPVPLGLVSQTFAEWELQHSDRKLLASDFDFTRATLIGEFALPTFLKRNLFPPTLFGRISAGISSGSLPPQRMFFVQGTALFFGPFGALKGAGLREFGGDSFVHFSLEHNFRSVPFLALDLPFLYENSIEFLVHGSAARSWKRSSTVLPFGVTTPEWYFEAGFGLSRLFGLMRIDFTRRFTPPRGSVFTIAVARIL
ncbi:MAG: DUF5686 family protein [Bacteroidota bacterium]